MPFLFDVKVCTWPSSRYYPHKYLWVHLFRIQKSHRRWLASILLRIRFAEWRDPFQPPQRSVTQSGRWTTQAQRQCRPRYPRRILTTSFHESFSKNPSTRIACKSNYKLSEGIRFGHRVWEINLLETSINSLEVIRLLSGALQEDIVSWVLGKGWGGYCEHVKFQRYSWNGKEDAVFNPEVEEFGFWDPSAVDREAVDSRKWAAWNLCLMNLYWDEKSVRETLLFTKLTMVETISIVPRSPNSAYGIISYLHWWPISSRVFSVIYSSSRGTREIVIP